MHTTIDRDEFFNAFARIYSMTTYTKLRSFQYLILTRSLISNSDLARYNVKDIKNDLRA